MPEEPASSESNERENRRLRAWELHQQGYSQRSIAATLGVTQGAVSQWIARVRASGSVESLRHRPAPGRSPALSQEQLAQLPSLLGRGPAAFGLAESHWTIRQIAAVVKETFGVSYHPAHLSRILRQYYPDWRCARDEPT